MSDDLKAMLDAVGRQFSDSQAETRRLFETSAESLRSEIRAVADGVMQTREDLVRETAGVRDEVRRTADETQAMIRFSHAELDRRVHALESTVADLRSRVERLESSTQ